ncbi:PTS sugar transporter subunit IIC [Erysipelothrix urinaevulpis]|uniref:PTS sugar transporter subunit IIC n=1 Tax=Erysipelothrix urinaevulpis TaxID=2683717 RepID=UPI00135805E7|nr:PTS transporter subunit EIIC [Erysipelothrix urinaevulpis]
MDKFVQFVDEKLSGPMTKLANQRHLLAIRNGIIATLPLIIVGSFFLIVAFIPFPETWPLVGAIKENVGQILLPYRLTMAIMTLYATFGIGMSLAESYELDGLSGGILATAAFLLTINPVSVEEVGFTIPMGPLGGGGMFVGIIAAIIAVEIYRFTDRSNFKISMPEQVPPSVARSFEALVPTAIIMLFFGSITYWFGFDWHGFIGGIVAPLVTAADTLPSVLLLVFLVTFFWSFGIHGVSIVGTIARPLWLQLIEKNGADLAAGLPISHIGAEPMFQWFIWIGGSGATIGLAIAMAFFSKSAYAKSLGRTSFAPAVFNINEPIIFGAPIVLNPILMIPFMVAPLVNTTIAWFAMSTGLVHKVVSTPPWTLPGPIGAFLATNFDPKAIILNVLLIIISFLIYYPFFKVYDNKLLAEEQGEVA